MKKLLLMTVVLALTLFQAVHSQTITIGTGTNVNGTTTYPTTYGAWYSQSRIQYLILASELSAGGLTGPTLMKSIAFNIQSTGGAGAHQNYTIKMKNTTASVMSAPPSGYDNSGFLTVFGPVSYTPTTTGWNQHVFTTAFNWDGTSNICIDICHDNGNSNFTYNAIVYNTTTSFTSTIQSWDDYSTAVMCPAGSSTISGYYTGNGRPNTQFEYVPSGPVLPPIANFYPGSQSPTFPVADTVWINSPYTILNTSSS